jgi:hypothetical protein
MAPKDTRVSDRYRRFNCRTWIDPRFRRLSKMRPSGQGLYVYLKTNLSTTNIPGLYRAGEAQLAEELEWPLQAFQKCWAEVAEQELAEADWKNRVVFLPELIEDDPPTSVNAVTGWRRTLDEIPDCGLKDRAIAVLQRHLEARGPEWARAFEAVESQVREKRRPLDEATRNRVKERDGNECRYCGVTVNWLDRRGPTGGTGDYVDPKGPATYENVVVSCRSCKERKGYRTPADAGMTLRTEPNRRQVVLSFGSRSDLDRKPGPAQVSADHPSGTQDPDQDQDQETDQDPERVWGVERKGTLNGYDLQRQFGIVRSKILGGLPWHVPGDKGGEVEAFAVRIADDDDALPDIVPTMRRACELIRDGHEEWRDRRMRDASFAFGCWRSKFTLLREELHHKTPVLPIRPGGGAVAVGFNPAAETR